MKRRDFLKTSAAAAGMVGSLAGSAALATIDAEVQRPTHPGDNRPADYLHRV
jgi:hypothetical protein